MQHTAIGLVLLAAAGLSSAQEMGQVISVTPISQQVLVPQQTCYQESIQPRYAPPTNGAGAVLGGLVGGLVGSALGSGSSGRSAAAMVGAFGGAIAGDQIQKHQPNFPQQVQRCQNQNSYEWRTVGYTVVYEYAGRQYTTQMAQPPGAQIPLQVTPLGSAPYGASGSTAPLGQPQPYAGPGYASSGVVTAPPNTFGTAPAYPSQPAYTPYAPAPSWSSYPEPASSWGMGPAQPFGQDLYR